MDQLNALAGAMPAVLLVPVYAAADRMWGDDRSYKGEKAVILLFLLAMGFVVGGITGPLFGVAWFLYRALPFPDGSQTPLDIGDFAGALIRHAAAIPPVLAIAYWRGLDMAQTGLVFAAFVLAAVALAGLYGRRLVRAEADIAQGRISAEQGNEQLKRFNGGVELVRGAAFGVAACFALSS